MSEPITPHLVEQEIMRLSALLDTATTEIAKRAHAAASLRIDAKVASARAFLEAAGSVDARKATAVVACEDALRGSEMADAVLLAAQEAARNTRAQLDALRSVNANARSLAGLS